MDNWNNGPSEGFGLGALPLGFGFGLAANENAAAGYARLTEAEKERIILRAKDATSKEEMERIINSLQPSDEEIKDIFQ